MNHILSLFSIATLTLCLNTPAIAGCTSCKKKSVMVAHKKTTLRKKAAGLKSGCANGSCSQKKSCANGFCSSK